MTQILNGKILSKFCSYLVCCNFDQNILVVKKHWQSMMSSRKFFGKSTKYRTTWTYCSLFFDNLKCLCLNLFILNYFCTSAWGKCADSIFFHLKISLTESGTKELCVKKPNKVSKTEKPRYLFLGTFWTLVPKIYFCMGDWNLGCLPMKFWDILNTFKPV